MNVSVFILVVLQMNLDVVYSDESSRDVSSLLDFYPEFVKIKEEVNKIKKGENFAFNYFKNYRVKAEHCEDAGRLDGWECWRKCIETDGCTSCSVDTKGGTSELCRVTYVSYDVLLESVGWDVFTRHTPVGLIQTSALTDDFFIASHVCNGLGLDMATFDDLKAAHELGYQSCVCGWLNDQYSYLVMQEVTEGCLKSIGVIKCPNTAAMNVYCKPKKLYPIKNEGINSMQIVDAQTICKSKGTSVASVADLMHAYYMGYESCTCGVADNENRYIIMQKPVKRCGMAVGVIECPFTRSPNWFHSWCKVK